MLASKARGGGQPTNVLSGPELLTSNDRADVVHEQCKQMLASKARGGGQPTNVLSGPELLTSNDRARVETSP